MASPLPPQTTRLIDRTFERLFLHDMPAMYGAWASAAVGSVAAPDQTLQAAGASFDPADESATRAAFKAGDANLAWVQTVTGSTGAGVQFADAQIATARQSDLVDGLARDRIARYRSRITQVCGHISHAAALADPPNSAIVQDLYLAGIAQLQQRNS